MSKEYESESLLSERSSDEHQHHFHSHGVKRTSRWNVSTGLGILLVISLLANLFQAIGISALPTISRNAMATVTEPRTMIAGLKENEIQISWEQHGEYANPNDTERNHLWDKISYDNGIVAVSKTWAAEKGLPIGNTFPWDTEKALYLVNAHHGLHCLKNVYRAFMEYQLDLPQTLSSHHVIHCLDQLHANVICTADDTQRVSTPGNQPLTAEGQTRSCRNWDKLNEWTLAHSACYRHGNGELEDKKESQIARFRFCEEGTPELEKVREYFGKGKDWRPIEEPIWSWDELNSQQKGHRKTKPVVDDY